MLTIHRPAGWDSDHAHECSKCNHVVCRFCTRLYNSSDTAYSPPVDVFERRPTVVLPVTPGPATPKNGSLRSDTPHADDLDKHVSHVLSKRQVFKRIMRGVWAYMKTRGCHFLFCASVS